MKPDYQLYLRKSASIYYKVVNGAVTTTSTPYDFGAQEGWANINAGIKRDHADDGVFRVYSPGMRFIFDAAKVFRHVFSTEGAEGLCQLEVWHRNQDWVYEFDFVADADFSTYKASENYIDIAFIETGIKQALFAKGNTNFEIPIAAPDAKSMYISGLPLRGKHFYVSYPFTYSDSAQSPPAPFYFPVSNYNKEGTYYEADDADLMAWPAGFPTYPSETQGFLANQDIQVTATLTGLNVFYELTSGWVATTGKLRIVVYVFAPDTPNAFPTTHVLYTDPGSYLSNGQNANLTNIAASATFTMNKGDKAFLAYQFEVVGSTAGFFNIVSSADAEFLYETKFYLQQSTLVGTPVYKVFQQLSNKITGLTNSGLSNFLFTTAGGYNNKPINTLLTSGGAVRGLPNPTLTLNMSDFKLAAKSTWGLGFGIINNQYRLEPMSFFYQKNTVIVNLGDLTKDLTISVARDLLASGYKTGYKTASNDELNGLQSFNNTHEYTLPMVKVNREINDISPFITDCYTIEYTRSKWKSETTVDTTMDKEIFMLEYDPSLISSGSYAVRRPNAILTGIIYDTGPYGYNLTPKMSLLRNGAHLRSILHLRDTQNIVFQTTDKNKDLQTIFLAPGALPPVVEKANVTVSSLPEPLFLPYYFEFEAVTPLNFIPLVNANPYGVIRFRFNGISYDGFIWDVSASPEGKSIRQFKLLCSPNVPMSSLA